MSATAAGTGRPTFDTRCDLEPALRNLERDCRNAHALAFRRRCSCANALWYGYGRFRGHGGFKDRLVALVGHFRRPRRPPDHPPSGRCGPAPPTT